MLHCLPKQGERAMRQCLWLQTSSLFSLICFQILTNLFAFTSPIFFDRSVTCSQTFVPWNAVLSAHPNELWATLLTVQKLWLNKQFFKYRALGCLFVLGNQHWLWILLEKLLCKAISYPWFSVLLLHHSQSQLILPIKTTRGYCVLLQSTTLQVIGTALFTFLYCPLSNK